MNIFAIREIYWDGVTNGYAERGHNYWLNPSFIKGVIIPDKVDVCTVCLTEQESILVTRKEAGYILAQILKTEQTE